MSRERRFATRTDVSVEAIVTLQDPQGSPLACTGKVRDYSQTGMRLDLERPVAMGTSLRVAVNGQHVEGTVRYCTSVRKRYMVGIEFPNTTS